MLRTIGSRRRLAALLVPSFLVVHLVCLCLPGSAAAAPSKDTAHDCCPNDAGKTPLPEHDASCGHCGVSELGVAPATSPTVPSVVVGPVVLQPVAVLDPSYATRRADGSRGSPPSVPPLRRKCVLIV